MSADQSVNRYARIMEGVFQRVYRDGDTEVLFRREDMAEVVRELGMELPKNLGDVVYSFRYRTPLPRSIQETAPEGAQWVILPAGPARYKFALRRLAVIEPNANMAQIKVPDGTPGVIGMYALDDEQALLAKLRYNRLVDIFTGVSCYSLQSHLRTHVPEVGQVETDEVYIGVDRHGAHYVFPIQAKGGRDFLSVVQIEQDLAMCRYKFSGLICRPVGAQFAAEDLIALFELESRDGDVRLAAERHYRLVPPEEISAADLKIYRGRSLE